MCGLLWGLRVKAIASWLVRACVWGSKIILILWVCGGCPERKRGDNLKKIAIGFGVQRVVLEKGLRCLFSGHRKDWQRSPKATPIYLSAFWSSPAGSLGSSSDRIFLISSGDLPLIIVAILAQPRWRSDLISM